MNPLTLMIILDDICTVPAGVPGRLVGGKFPLD
jgi:hypothetical protein